jgi:hypothetical protein
VSLLICAFRVERVTGIEPALSAWESVPSGPVKCPELRSVLSASDREGPLCTRVNGTLMARRVWSARADLRVLVLRVLLDSCHPSGRGRRVKAREATACGLALTRRTRPRQSSSEEDGITSLEGVLRTAVRTAELATPMLPSTRDSPLLTVANGPLMARRSYTHSVGQARARRC